MKAIGVKYVRAKIKELNNGQDMVIQTDWMQYFMPMANLSRYLKKLLLFAAVFSRQDNHMQELYQEILLKLLKVGFVIIIQMPLLIKNRVMLLTHGLNG